jgi:hypothetical protein
MNRVARKRVKRSGRGIGDSLNEVTDFSGLETLLDHNVCCWSRNTIIVCFLNFDQRSSKLRNSVKLDF